MIRSHDPGKPRTDQGAGRDDHFVQASLQTLEKQADRRTGAAGAVLPARRRPMRRPMPRCRRSPPRNWPRSSREAMGRYDDRGTIRVVFTDTQDMNCRFEHEPGDPRGAEADAGLVPRPGPVRERRDAMAGGVRLDDAEFTARPGCGPTDGRRGSTAPERYRLVSQNDSSSSANPPPTPGSGPPDHSIWERNEELVRMLEETDRKPAPRSRSRNG